ncbi:ATP-binding protein [Streptomyces sp. HPF1205]|uniref:ATP-binding protein n=1 Tax=Streptomyces sp. HPF1205 TaxID=2873262 RepID=UPI001CEC3437|nr:ATP-binding protein [Streptomyces sp. HPF1205]
MNDVLPVLQLPTGDWYAAENLPRVPESAERARRMARTAIASWGLLRLSDQSELLVTELVSNAVKHAQGEGLRVTVLRLSYERVRIGVHDRDRTRPRIKPVTLDGESGRGLLLIDALSVSWGVDLLPGGKRVWVVLEAAS